MTRNGQVHDGSADKFALRKTLRRHRGYPGGVDWHWRTSIRLRRRNGAHTGKRLAGKLHEPFERAGGAKGGGQGECAPAKHALDSEPGSRVTGAGAYTASNCRHTPEVGEAMGRAAEVVAPSSSIRTDGGCPVVQINDLSRSLAAFDPASTLVVVVEMSKASWLVSGVVPGVERQPLKKLEPDATA